MAKKVEAILTLAVQYGNVTVGDETISVGVKTERKNISLSAADKHLIGKRLIGCVTCRPGNGNADQKSLMDADVEVAAAFDVNGIHVTRKKLSFGLSFARSSVDMTTITDFAKRSGDLIITEIGEIPKEEKKVVEEDDDEEEDE